MKNSSILKKNQQSHSITFRNNRFGPSQMELDLGDYIHQIYPNLTLIKGDVDVIGSELDILIPEKNIAFEFDGTWWHRAEKVGQNYHLNKTNLCYDKNVGLIHISSEDWIYDNLNTLDLVKSVLDDNHYNFNIEQENDNLKLYSNNILVATCLHSSNNNEIHIHKIASQVNRQDVISYICRYFNDKEILFDIDLYHDSLLFYTMKYDVINKTSPNIMKCHDSISMYDCGTITIKVI